jgi:hypothetical protein
MLLRIFLQMGVYSKKSFKIISPILVALGLLTLDTFDCQAQGVIQWENNYGGSDRDKLNWGFVNFYGSGLIVYRYYASHFLRSKPCS